MKKNKVLSEAKWSFPSLKATFANANCTALFFSRKQISPGHPSKSPTLSQPCVLLLSQVTMLPRSLKCTPVLNIPALNEELILIGIILH